MRTAKFLYKQVSHPDRGIEGGLEKHVSHSCDRKLGSPDVVVRLGVLDFSQIAHLTHGWRYGKRGEYTNIGL